MAMLKAGDLVKLTSNKKEINYIFDKFDIRWTKKKAWIIGIASFLSGFYSGSIGGSGSLFISTVLISMKVRP
jgi:uncharacterized membrane protein YfcA